MDDSNSLSKSILQSNNFAMSDSVALSGTYSNTGFFDSIKNISFMTWVIIFFILAFLGFNIFVYLAKGTQDITTFFGPLVQKIFGTAVSTTGEIIDVSAEGAKAVVGETANIINSGLTEVQNVTPNTASSSVKSQPVQNTIQQPDALANDKLNQALNASKPQQMKQNQEYEADYAASSIQGGGKAGWCYIGEDRGFRSCSKVNENDTCMSGEIFPSQEICVNPNLRT